MGPLQTGPVSFLSTGSGAALLLPAAVYSEMTPQDAGLTRHSTCQQAPCLIQLPCFQKVRSRSHFSKTQPNLWPQKPTQMGEQQVRALPAPSTGLPQPTSNSGEVFSEPSALCFPLSDPHTSSWACSTSRDAPRSVAL